MAGPSLSPVLVGRVDELAAARRALDRPGSVVAILGEAGVGKSRLAREVAALATAEGRLVLTGNCFDRGQAALAPVTSAIRQHTRQLDAQALDDLFTGQARLASHLFPELSGLSTQKTLVAPVRAADVVDAVSLILQRIATGQSALMVIEDLQWAGPDTMDLVVALAQRAHDVPFSLIVTSRAEAGASTPQLSALEALRDCPRTIAIALRPLAAADARDMVDAMSVGGIDDSLADSIVRRSHGVPLFVEELYDTARTVASVGHGAIDSRAPGGVPVAISEAILARVRTLHPDALRLLTVAAVAGEQIDRRLTATAAGSSVARVEQALQVAAAFHLVKEDDDSDGVRWSFRHALIRDTLLGELRGVERRRAHVQVAEALRAQYGADIAHVAARVCQHYRAADEPGDAMPYALEAARHAVRRGARAETLTHFRLALRLAGESAADPLPVLLEAADASFLILDDDQTGEFAREARRLANRRGDRLAEARALTYMARLAYRAAGRLEEAISLSEDALALCTGLDAYVEADVIEHLVAWTDHATRDASPPLITRGLDLARAAGNRRALAALELQVARSAISADAAEAACSRAIGAARASGDLATEALVLGNSAYVLVERGRLDRARELALEDLELTDFVPADRSWVLALLGWIAALRGEFEDALRWTDQVPGVTDAITRIIVNRTRVEVALRRGDLAEARRAASAVEPHERAPAEHQVALRVQVASDPSAAQPAARAMIAGEWPPGPSKANLAAAPWAVVHVARALVRTGQETLARELADAVLTGSPSRGQQDPGSGAAADVLRGIAAMVARDYATAEAVLRRAADAFGEAPMPARRVEALTELAAAQSAAGRKDDAAASLAAAHAVASDIGAWSLVDRAAAAARALGVRSLGSSRDRAGLGELSERETDVARLVAEGCSNAEIASRLFLSPRTAANHVSNILSKLGVRRRSEIARWAVENGLVGTTAGAADSSVRSRARLTVVDGSGGT